MTRGMKSAARHRRTFAAALRPPPRLSVSEWAERYRILTSETSAEAGRWANRRTPYLVEIMDALSPSSEVAKVVLMKASRVGGTEVLNNVVAAYMHSVKCPIMVVQPSEADAEEWSKDHLDGMIQSTDVLRDLVAKDSGQRSKGNTILHKKYKGGILYTVGASTPKSFRRRTVRLLAGDELDGYPQHLQGEGSPWALAQNRTDTFTFNKKIFGLSTPTIKGASAIEAEFELSDKRYYHVPCTECGHMQRLVWGQLKWTDERDEQGLPVAEYCCAACGSLIPHHRKAWMVSRGRWVPTAESQVRGYHISSLYSPWMTWGQLAQEWLDKKDDPVKLQPFVNTRLAETWDVANAEKWDETSFLTLLEPIRELPRRVAVLTAGVDVQDDRLVMQVDAWGPHEERWTVERRDLLGDPSGGEVWAELERALLSEYPLEGGGVLRIRAACIDSGGHHTTQVYQFAKRHHRRNWWAIKGIGGEGRPLWSHSSRKNKLRALVHFLGVDAGKEACHARLRRSLAAAQNGQVGGPGYWHFSEGTLGPDYFAELTNEVCVTISAGGKSTAGRRRWIVRNQRVRNEALDISVYAMAALYGLLAVRAVRLDLPARPAEPRQGDLPLFEPRREVVSPVPDPPVIPAQTKSPGDRAEIKSAPATAPAPPAPRPSAPKTRPPKRKRVPQW